MTPDQIMAAPVYISLALLLTNSWALLRDGRAYGVRPYLSIWILISNGVMASQLLQMGQLWVATALAVYGAVSGVNATLIAYFRWRQAR